MPNSPHILFTGGGTLGPVTPLLAVVDELKQTFPQVRISWIGTPHGPEGELIESRHETFYELAAPKLSRHAWWQWPFIGPFFALSCLRAYFYLRQIQPDAVVSAGAYVSVPVAFVARLLRIPVLIHQLDVRPGLANRLMAYLANRITVTWQESADVFPAKKVRIAGGMLRPGVIGGDKAAFLSRCELDKNKPTVFVLGGGTGAKQINDAIEVLVPELLKKANIVHLTGKGKLSPELDELGERSGYYVREFMTQEMRDAYATADVVVARAGMGTIFEIAGLAKAAIFVPIQGTHQEANARVMEERGAARVLWQCTPQLLLQEIEKLLDNQADRDALGQAAKRAVSMRGAERIAEEVQGMLEK